MMKEEPKKPPTPSFLPLLKPYWGLIFPLILLALASNGLTLWLPRLLSQGIDGFLRDGLLSSVLWKFGLTAGGIFLLTYGQSILQTYASERVARDMRADVSDKLATLSFADVQSITPATLLTNLTSDVDAVKNLVSQVVVHIVSSVLLLIGGSVLLLSINWRLGLSVLAILPLIGITFFFILGKVRTLFAQTREVIDRLNKTINESILGAALIRVLHSQASEHHKFAEVNTQSKDLGMAILKLFSAMIPIITFAVNLATLLILVLGGRFIIMGSMSLGEFAAFNSYLTILIFPIFILGFVGNIIAQAQASYQRIWTVLSRPKAQEDGTISATLKGALSLKNVGLQFGEKVVLKGISLDIAPGSKVAIIGPTAAGKTQLLNLLVGLVQPSEGEVLFDGHAIQEYQCQNLYKQVGLVFQDSSLFQMSVRENIAFTTDVAEEHLQKAIETAELSAFVQSLPDGLETVVSERGMNLSGGQKQRIMLARALAIHPKVLLLDDFTARVDMQTEKKILDNLSKNYPDLTLVSITQKIASVEEYDQIIVLMDGEIIARGTHEQLMCTSPEYVQMHQSQQSTNLL